MRYIYFPSYRVYYNFLLIIIIISLIKSFGMVIDSVESLLNLVTFFYRSASEQRILCGHSGPVYGLSFNNDKSFLVSSSEDGTGNQFDYAFDLEYQCFRTIADYPIKYLPESIRYTYIIDPQICMRTCRGVSESEKCYFLIEKNV